MSKKRISRSTMDTCFKILQLKFDQKLANRCIGLANTNVDWSLFCDTDALSIHRWCDQIPQWSHRWSNPAIAHRLRLVGSFEPTPAVTHIHLEWNLQAVDEHQPARNGPGSSVQPLKKPLYYPARPKPRRSAAWTGMARVKRNSIPTVPTRRQDDAGTESIRTSLRIRQCVQDT